MDRTPIPVRSLPPPENWAYFWLLLAGVLVLVGLMILLGFLLAVLSPSAPCSLWVVLAVPLVPALYLGLKLRPWLVVRDSMAVAQAEIVDRGVRTMVGSYGRKYRRCYVTLKFDSVRTDGSVKQVAVRAHVNLGAYNLLPDSVNVHYSRAVPHMLVIEGE